MFQVRFHGRGGQGVVTAAELLAAAAFREGRYAQAFPSFGSERMGAPVMSFCRIDDKPIRTREPVTEPDALLIQDPTLLHQADLFAGLDARRLRARQRRPAASPNSASTTSPPRTTATGCSRSRPPSLAMAHLGRPLPGAPLLGGLAALTGVVSLDAVLAAISDRFTGQVAAGNAAAAGAAFDYVTAERRLAATRKALTDA